MANTELVSPKEKRTLRLLSYEAMIFAFTLLATVIVDYFILSAAFDNLLRILQIILVIFLLATSGMLLLMRKRILSRTETLLHSK